MAAGVTRSRIESWDHAADALAEAGRRWTGRADELDAGVAGYLHHIARPAGSHWAGAAADSALQRALADRDPVLAAADNARTLSTVAAAGAAALLGAQARALGAIADAENDGFIVEDDLSLLDTGGHPAADGDARRLLALDHLGWIDHHAAALQATDTEIARALHAGADEIAVPLNWRTGGGGDGDPPPPRWTAKDLYRGDPSAHDINQDALGDCYLVATMGAVADANPQWIRDRIRYDPATGNFDVTLWNGSRWQHITVGQADIDADIAVRGGSGLDNGDPHAPLWPAVIESAYAKLIAPGSSIDDALTDGIGRGGHAADALQALTGNRGLTLYPAIEWFTAQHIDQQIAAALAHHESVTISTSPSPGALVESHVYSVEQIAGAGSDARVTLRNPWGPDNGPPLITVSLGELVGSGIPGALGRGPVRSVTIGRF